MYQNEKYSDLVIKCKGQTFNIHRATVCPQCPFLEGACSSGFRATSERVIDLSADEPEILGKFLEYLCTGMFTDPDNPEVATHGVAEVQDDPLLTFQLAISGFHPEENSHPEHKWPGRYAGPGDSRPHDDAMRDYTSSLLTSLRVYVMADKYLVPSLKMLACNRFIITAKYQSMSAEDFPSVLDELFESTGENDDIRSFICGLVTSQCVDPAVRGRWRDVMLAHPAFAIDVLDRVMDFGFAPSLIGLTTDAPDEEDNSEND